MSRRLYAAAAAAIGALTLGMAATPASAALTLAAGEENCDLYSSAGCLFDFENGDGNIFDDASAYEGAYNAEHDDVPPLLELGEFTDKFEFGGDNLSELINASFDVSFYAVKSGSNQVLLFGLDPATDSFTATNTRLLNNGGQIGGISHVTVFGTDGGGGNEIPEPATWAMMIMGFGGVGAMMRRRRYALA